MCGIFAILYCDDDTCEQHLIDPYFMKGKKRGPEISSIRNVQPDILFGFHRLAINGLDVISNQPIQSNQNQLICNGEIYNYKQLFQKQELEQVTNSDCEVIVKSYEQIGTHCINTFDGVFSFILYDHTNNQVIVARDPYGVRPLYMCMYKNKNIGFSSDIEPLLFDKNIQHIQPFQPGTFAIFKKSTERFFNQIHHERYFYNISYMPGSSQKPIEFYMYHALEYLKSAIYKRVNNCEREIASLLSGGLDSSIVCAYVNRFYKKKTNQTLETYSIGLKNGEDLKYASMVAKHIQSNHTEHVVSNDLFIDSIPNVIKDIESYDTTTVRASVGNWNIGKYISEKSNAKVIFNGDGADELMGGYLYFHYAPNDEEFDKEQKRLLSNISRFDVLRCDKSISSHGLEPRTPFLDREFTKIYLSIPVEYRNHTNDNKCEKYLIRKAIELYDPSLLPIEVLWRKKEAFSDGVSSLEKSWYEIIQDNLKKKELETQDETISLEQNYYKQLFNSYFPNCEHIIPYYWMPKFVKTATDSSARTLDIYNKSTKV